MDRWPLSIALGLLIMVMVNGLLVYLAVSEPPEIEPSYEQAGR